MNRRDFLTASAAGAAVLGTRELWGQEAKPLPVVDTHHHLWDLSRFTLPWLGESHPLKRNFVMSDYREATKGANVVKTVYMEVNVKESQQQQEADYVLDLCRQKDNPMVAAVVGGYPHSDTFAAYVRGLSKNQEIKGIRTVLHDPDRPKGLCLQPGFVRNIQLLGELGLSFDLCMRPEEIVDGVRLAQKCPKTRFIVDHCGNMSVTSTDAAQRKKWQEGIRAAAQQENMVCKISGIVVTAKEDDWKPADLADNMNFCMEAFGQDRAFFGGDWPVCTLRASFVQWVDALKWIVRDRPTSFQQKLFHDNAVRFYGLS